ncbi:MAG: hypothetical protein LBE22_04640, partial [Azoarcus sp.]|nr:hypothetical protein [Azoarcus sp.]
MDMDKLPVPLNQPPSVETSTRDNKPPEYVQPENTQELEQQILEQQRLEQQSLEQLRLEQQRLEQLRLEQQRLEQLRLEQQRLEQLRLEQQKPPQQKPEPARVDPKPVRVNPKPAQQVDPRMLSTLRTKLSRCKNNENCHRKVRQAYCGGYWNRI